MKFTAFLFVCFALTICNIYGKHSGGSRSEQSSSSIDRSPSSWSSGSSSHHNHHHSDWTSWTSWNTRTEDTSNTNDILQGLAIFGAADKITKDRYKSTFNGVTYYHGSRFYAKSANDKQTCHYSPKFIYYAQYSDFQQINEILFECNLQGQYCCELECCSTMGWWIAIVIFSVLGIIVSCVGCYFCCKSVDIYHKLIPG